jgi:hypothetical protein
MFDEVSQTGIFLTAGENTEFTHTHLHRLMLLCRTVVPKCPFSCLSSLTPHSSYHGDTGHQKGWLWWQAGRALRAELGLPGPHPHLPPKTQWTVPQFCPLSIPFQTRTSSAGPQGGTSQDIADGHSPITSPTDNTQADTFHGTWQPDLHWSIFHHYNETPEAFFGSQIWRSQVKGLHLGTTLFLADSQGGRGH